MAKVSSLSTISVKQLREQHISFALLLQQLTPDQMCESCNLFQQLYKINLLLHPTFGVIRNHFTWFNKQFYYAFYHFNPE